MATHTHGNWSFGRRGELPFREGDVVRGLNLSQLRPDTPICAEVRDLTFRRCNLTNVRPQPTWILDQCNTGQIEFCTNERPDLAASVRFPGGLEPCPSDCRHRVSAGDWQPIPEPVFRQAKADARLLRPAPQVRILEAQDADGIRTQRFEALLPVYEHKPLPPHPEMVRRRAERKAAMRVL